VGRSRVEIGAIQVFDDAWIIIAREIFRNAELTLCHSEPWIFFSRIVRTFVVLRRHEPFVARPPLLSFLRRNEVPKSVTRSVGDLDYLPLFDDINDL